MKPTSAALLILVLGGAACGTKLVDPCDGIVGACLGLQIDPSTDVDRIDAVDLEVTVAGQIKTLHSSFADGTARPLPVAVGLTLSDVTIGDRAQLDLVVTGELAGNAVGSATASRTIARGQHDTIHVQLTRGGGGGDLGDDGAVADLAEVDLTDGSVPTYPLTVDVTGNGSVSAAPVINCPGTCSDNYPAGTMVTLTATAGSDSLFGGWSGDCKGSDTTCLVTLDQARSVSAMFGLKTLVTVTYSVTSPAVGTITSTPPGIDCPGTCSAEFALGSTITLTGTPTLKTGSWFGSWTGDCTGNQPECSLLVNAPKTTTGAFVPVNYMFVLSYTKKLPLATPTDNDGTEFSAVTNCVNAAENAGLPLNKAWRAWLSFSGPVRSPDPAGTPVNATQTIVRVGARGGTTTPRGWIRPDNRPFADSISAFTQKTGLSDNQIFYLPNVNEKGGNPPMDAWVITGTAGSGQYPGADIATCGNGAGVDYNSSNPTTSDFVGTPYGASTAWTIAFQGANRQLCSGDLYLYCFENDYNTAIVPPRIKGRYAFVSLGLWDPSLGIANADQLCHDEAVAGNLMQGDDAAVWKAVLATTTASAASRFTTVGRMNWVRPDGVQITAHPGDLFDLSTPLLAALNLGSDGTHYFSDSEYAFTGSDAGFTSVGTNTCNDWKPGGTSGARGIVAYANAQMSYSSAVPSACAANQAHVYCLQDSDPP